MIRLPDALAAIEAVAAANPSGGQLRVGLDVSSVPEMAEAVARFGSRYTERLFTPHELASCPGDPGVAAGGLAARFAAKEAMLKVLRPEGARPEWRSIEVRRHPSGWCDLVLHDRAALLAKEAGVRMLALSLTHEGEVAAAIVVALCSAGESPSGEEAVAPGSPTPLAVPPDPAPDGP